MEDKTLTTLMLERYNEVSNKLEEALTKQTKIFIALGWAVAELNAVQDKKVYTMKDFWKGGFE